VPGGHTWHAAASDARDAADVSGGEKVPAGQMNGISLPAGQ
jgi:hypothetical protein